METYIILAVIAVGLFILELFTPAFVAGSMGIGMAFSALGAYFNLSDNWLIAIFIFFTIITIFTIRPLMIKYAYKKSQNIKTNADAMIGKDCIVIEEVTNSSGNVKLDGDIWSARSANKDEIFTVGSTIKIERRDSIIVYVK